MSRRLTFALALCSMFLWTLSGCGDKPASDGDHDHAEGSHAHADGDHAEGDHAEGDADHHADAEADPGALSAEDQALVKAQKVCPVSGEELGGMGDPYKLIYKGRPIFLCCKGCEADFLKDPEKYIKKLSH